MRIISEDITNKRIAKSNGGWGGEKQELCSVFLLHIKLCAPWYLKIIAEITGNIGSEWGRTVSPDKPFSGAAQPKSFSLFNICAAFSVLMRTHFEKENLPNKMNTF